MSAKINKSFIVYGEPYGKKNMRPFKRGDHFGSFSPKENINYLTSVKMSYVSACGSFRFNDDAQIRVIITAYKQIPKSFSKKKVELARRGLLLPIIKPDCDNISKAICDGLNKLAFRDDSQVVELIVKKRYGETPRVEVSLIEDIFPEL